MKSYQEVHIFAISQVPAQIQLHINSFMPPAECMVVRGEVTECGTISYHVISLHRAWKLFGLIIHTGSFQGLKASDVHCLEVFLFVFWKTVGCKSDSDTFILTLLSSISVGFDPCSDFQGSWQFSAIVTHKISLKPLLLALLCNIFYYIYLL